MSTNSRLTDEQIDGLAERLRRGEYLEEYLRPLLFRQAKEYELAYRDKAPRSRVVSEAMGVPWQTLKRFGSSPTRVPTGSTSCWSWEPSSTADRTAGSD